MRPCKSCLVPILLAIPVVASARDDLNSKRAITVEDCVRTRRVFEGEVALSPDGAAVAYVVESPDVETNKNEYRLYVRNLAHAWQRENGRALREETAPIRGLKWVARGTKLIIVEETAGKQTLKLINPLNNDEEVVAAPDGAIVSVSSDASGEMFVYATQLPAVKQSVSRDVQDRGYPVIFGKGTSPPVGNDHAGPSESAIFKVKKQKSGLFSTTRLFYGSENQPSEMPVLTGVRALSLSPDGRYLAFNYVIDEIPQAWKNNPYSAWVSSGGTKQRQLALGIYDFQEGHFKVAFNCLGAGRGMPVVWAADSHAFTALALSPAGSTWEQRDRQLGFTIVDQADSFTHLFCVDLRTGAIGEVLEKPMDAARNETLWWKDSDGKMLVWNDPGRFVWLIRKNGIWKETQESRLSFDSAIQWRGRVNSLSGKTISDGAKVVSFFEQPMVPPDLFMHDLAQGRTTVLTDLNPEYRGIQLGKVERVEWQDRFGLHLFGFLIKPVGYEPGRRYPLVIMTKGWETEFYSDTGFHTAFPPQPLANAGFLVLLANVPPSYDVLLNKTLQKYPGRLGEAFEFISMIESAVDMLEQRGLADKNHVGIIGFSRTSWQTDFMLTHSSFPFAAASSADSGIYTYPSYSKFNSQVIMSDWETELGGPPYGPSFDNWLRFAPEFNAGNVRTPLLMEYTQSRGDLVENIEFFVALKRQDKPVDLFYYPKGQHVLDSPYGRVASLQRNVDWFRFWMQSYEGSSPSYDPSQYSRWNELRNQVTSGVHHEDKKGPLTYWMRRETDGLQNARGAARQLGYSSAS